MATFAGQYAFRTQSGVVYRYGVDGRLRIDVDATMLAERLLREIRPTAWMPRIVAAVCTFAAVFSLVAHVYRPYPPGAAPPSPPHSVLGQNIIAHNIATQQCLADISSCGDGQ